MDPLSITSTALAFAGIVLKSSIKARNYVGDLQEAPQTISDVAEEIQTIQAALRSVNNAIEQDPHVIDRFELEEVFAVAVRGCHATLMCINKEYEQLFGRQDWKARLLVLWKENDMEGLLGRLDRKKASIGILVQTLNLRSTQEIRACLTKNQPTLDVAKQDLCDLIPSYPGCHATILDSLDQDTVDSLLGDRDSYLSATEFDFDLELINTKTYKRALARLQATSGRKKGKKKNKGTGSKRPRYPSSHGSATEGSDSVLSCVPEYTEDTFEDLIDLSYEPASIPPSDILASTPHPDLEGLCFPSSTRVGFSPATSQGAFPPQKSSGHLQSIAPVPISQPLPVRPPPLTPAIQISEQISEADRYYNHQIELGIAWEVLGPWFGMPTVQLLLSQGSRVSRKDWVVIKGILDVDQQARKDLKKLTALVEEHVAKTLYHKESAVLDTPVPLPSSSLLECQNELPRWLEGIAVNSVPSFTEKAITRVDTSGFLSPAKGLLCNIQEPNHDNSNVRAVPRRKKARPVMNSNIPFTQQGMDQTTSTSDVKMSKTPGVSGVARKSGRPSRGGPNTGHSSQVHQRDDGSSDSDVDGGVMFAPEPLSLRCQYDLETQKTKSPELMREWAGAWFCSDAPWTSLKPATGLQDCRSCRGQTIYSTNLRALDHLRVSHFGPEADTDALFEWMTSKTPISRTDQDMDSSSTLKDLTEIKVDTARPTSDKSTPSMDEAPITIATRALKSTRSQTSLLIEYFESGKTSPNADERRPSVRVRVNPSKKGKSNHIQVPKGTRKPSQMKRVHLDHLRDSDSDSQEAEDASAYASATKGSRLSRNPIHINIARGHRRYRPSNRNAHRLSEPETLYTAAPDVESRHTARHRKPVSTSAIDNAKSIENVEDVIRRLILPELGILKGEQRRRRKSRSIAD